MDRNDLIAILGLAAAVIVGPMLASACEQGFKQKAATDQRLYELEVLRLQLAASARPCASAPTGAP